MPSDSHEIDNLAVGVTQLTESQLKSSQRFRKATVKGLNALRSELEALEVRTFEQNTCLVMIPSRITNLTVNLPLGTPKEEAKLWKEAACEAVEILCVPDPA